MAGAGVTVGEVNATMRIQVASDLRIAKQELLEAEGAFKSMGTAGAGALQQMRDNLEQARANVASLTEAQKSLKGSSDEAGIGFSNLDTMATRLIARLAILYAVRQSVDFVAGIFEAAAALEELSTQTGLSIDKLQTLQIGADQVNIPFTKISNAVETLQKNLDQFKPSSVDAIVRLGLSMEDIMSKSPDAKLDAIGNALANISSKSERGRYEMALFGTEGIDPLISKYKSLAAAAEESGRKMGDDTVSGLAAAEAGFKQIGGVITSFISSELASAQKSFADIWTPLWAFANNGGSFTDRINAAKIALDLIDGSMNYVKGSAAGLATELPKMGQAFVDEEKAMVDIPPETRYLMDQLHEMGDLNATTAARINATTEMLKTYNLELKNEAKALAESNAGYARYNASVMAAYEAGTKLAAVLAKEQEEVHKLADSQAQLHNIQSDMPQSLVDAFKGMAPIDQAKANIAILQQQDEKQKALLQTVLESGAAEKELTRATEEYGRIHEQIATKILAEQDKITQAIMKNAQAAREARGDRMAAQGQNLQGLPSDSNINVADAAQRKYNETVAVIDAQVKLGAMAQADASELMLKAARDFDKAVGNTGTTIIGMGKTTGTAGMAATIGLTNAGQGATHFAQAAMSASQTFNMGGSMSLSGLSPDVAAAKAQAAGGEVATDYYGNKYIHIAGVNDPSSPRFRASGGPVEAGKSYQVGEHGQETFVPSTPGMMLPSGTGLGGSNISVQVVVNGSVLSDKTQLANAVGDAFITKLRNLGIRINSGA